jgi:hypothetical protein
MTENRPHLYRDSFCERVECGRDEDDPIHNIRQLLPEPWRNPTDPARMAQVM